MFNIRLLFKLKYGFIYNKIKQFVQYLTTRLEISRNQTTSQFQNNFGAAPENPVKSTDKLTNEVLYQCPVTHEKKYLIQTC